MKTIICGSRRIINGGFVHRELNVISDFKITEVVSGGCRGVDKIGEKWAKLHFLPVRIFNADWSRFGKAAGPIRNADMAFYADCCIAFWDMKSRGTGEMISYMEFLRKPIIVIDCSKWGIRAYLVPRKIRSRPRNTQNGRFV